MAAANRELIRAINRFNILNAIRTSGRMSRVEIARATGLSQASVTGITAELIGEGLLRETETGVSHGGRRPVLLALNPGGAYALGVYLSIHQIGVVIIDFEATILSSHAMTLTETHYRPEVLADKVAQLEKDNRRLQQKLKQAELIIEAQKKMSEILGISQNLQESDETK